MNKEAQVRHGCITVIPYFECHPPSYTEVVVNKLYFWYNNTFSHPINDETISRFLLNVKMFGATIFPERPEKGCISLDGDKSFDPGEIMVSQIHYKGDVIYCRS